jgi:hypothetical protein
MRAARLGRCIVFPTISLGFFALLALSGCGEPDVVRTYDEKPPPKPAATQIPADQQQFRTLAAMIPSDDIRESGPQWWFLKISGSTATVDKYAGDFDKLIGSIKVSMDENNPISWELPAGWTRAEAPASRMRYATLKAPGDALELSVTRFGGSVLANVQRWWGELWGKEKAQDFTAAMLQEYVQQRSVNGRLILRVDLHGPNEPPKRPMMMMNNPHGGM